MTAQSLIHHEDLKPGASFPLGTRTLTADEIIAFGRAYDPQPMHIDEEAAKATLVGGLCASGFHTCAMMMRMACDGLLNRMASLGSPGVEEVLWKKPVRPGEPYAATYRVLETRDMASRPDVGLSKITVELHNAKGELAAYWVSIQLTRRRHPLETLPPKQPSAPRATLPDFWDGPAEPAGQSIEGFFEDRQIGATVAYPPHTFTREAIIDFARQFDPQPFHLDEEAAKASLFGGLCASGWHTAAIFIRSIVAARMTSNAAARAQGVRLPAYGPSPGFRNLRWFKPVFVGDTVEFRGRVADKIDLKSRPERGLVVTDVQGRNQKGELVFAITAQILAERLSPYRPT